MLKWVYVNNKKIPVPVPVKTLGQAVVWLDRTLVPPGHTITRIILDGRHWCDEDHADSLTSESALDRDSKLEVRIDSPTDLAIQTVSAIRNLADVVQGGLKGIAVNCWQLKPSESPIELASVENDIELMIDLVGHLQGLLEQQSQDISQLLEWSDVIRKSNLALAMAKSNSDWRGCARILLNKLEPQLEKLAECSDDVHISLLKISRRPVTTGAKTGS